MRVLRPQVEELNAKYPGQDKAVERQRAIMELYSRAGGESDGGCVPMLLQMPILVRSVHVLSVGYRIASPEFPLGTRLVYL